MGIFSDEQHSLAAAALLVLIFCASAVIVFIAVRSYTGVSESRIEQSGPTLEQVNVNRGLSDAFSEEVTQPSGTLLFTTRTEPDGPMQVLAIDVGDESVEEVMLFADEFALTAFVESDSQTNPSRAIFNAYSELSQEEGFQGVGAHIVDLNAAGDTDRVTFLSAAEGGLLARLFSWSPDGALVAFSRFVGVPSGYEDFIETGNWEVIVVDVARDEVVLKIDDAIQPVWSPNERKFLYLKSDGLYLYDFSSRKTENVLGVLEGNLHAEGMYDVSPDGKYLVWTSSDFGVTVMEIMSWDPFQIEEQGRIVDRDVEYYWPQFSPDSSFYVVQAINTWNANEERTNPRFEIRHVLDRSIIKTISLQGHDFNAFFTDDWVTGLQE